MKVLAIESSGRLGGLALIDSAGGLLAETRFSAHASHSETLMGETDHVLRLAGLRADEIELVAVSAGPGAFTGLRVGLGTAKGLAFATGAKVAAVPTLEAYASGMPFCGLPVATVLDARKKEVYAGLFDISPDGEARRVISERATGARDFALMLEGRERVVFAGQGALQYRKEIEEAFSGEAIFAPAHLMHPMPAPVGLLGLRMAEKGLLTEPGSLAPMYLRKSEAERGGKGAQ